MKTLTFTVTFTIEDMDLGDNFDGCELEEAIADQVINDPVLILLEEAKMSLIAVSANYKGVDV